MENPHQIVIDYSLPSSINERALDLGAGNGRDSYYLAKNLGYMVDAVDNASRGMLTENNHPMAHLTNIAKKENLPIYAQAINMQDFPFQENHYSLIIAIHSLQFLDDISFVAEKIVFGLRPRGRFICSLITRTIKAERGAEANITNIKPRITLESFTNLFSDLKILLSEENLVHDSPHIGAPDPHIHSIIQFVGEK